MDNPTIRGVRVQLKFKFRSIRSRSALRLIRSTTAHHISFHIPSTHLPQHHNTTTTTTTSATLRAYKRKGIKGIMTRLYPLFILLFVLLILGTIFYITYSIIQDVKRNTRSKMEKKNVTFSRDGVTVGVKEMKDEDYLDRSQRYIYLLPQYSFPLLVLKLILCSCLCIVSSLACGIIPPSLRIRVDCGI